MQFLTIALPEALDLGEIGGLMFGKSFRSTSPDASISGAFAVATSA